MDANDERRLALAAEVWRAARASDREVEQHVVRVARRLRTSRRHHPLRRFLAFLIAIVSFGGALAFAASGTGILRWPGQPRTSEKSALGAGRPVPVPEPVSERKGSGSALRTATPEPAPASSPPDPALPKAPETAATGEQAAAPKPTAARLASRAAPGSDEAGQDEELISTSEAAPGRTRHATGSGAAETRLWHTVSSALAEDDLSTAAGALQQLATRGSIQTRTKAKLGLVQLAVSRGDCQQAERLAKGLAADPNVEDKIVSRALSAARTCFGR